MITKLNNNKIGPHQIRELMSQHNKATNNLNNTLNVHKKLITITHVVNGNNLGLVINIISTQNLNIMPISLTTYQVKKLTQISKENFKAKPKMNKSFLIKWKNILSTKRKLRTKKDKICRNTIAKWNSSKCKCMKRKRESFLILL